MYNRIYESENIIKLLEATKNASTKMAKDETILMKVIN